MFLLRKPHPYQKVLVALMAWSLVMVGLPMHPMSNAKAASKSTVYVLGFVELADSGITSKQEGLTEAIKEQLSIAFDDAAKISLVDKSALEKKLTPPKAEGSDIEPSEGLKGSKKDYSDAKKLMKKGFAAIEDEEFEDAVDHLEGALKAIAKTPNQVKKTGLKNLAKLYVGLAVARFELDEEKAGKDALASALAIDPDLDLAQYEMEYPKALTKAFAAVQKAKGTARLTVTAYPKDKVSIKVNGRSAGNGETLRDLRSGLYLVQVKAEGYETYNNAIELSGTENLKVRLPGGEEEQSSAPDLREDLNAAEKMLAKGQLNDEFMGHLDKVCAAGGINYVAFGLFYKEKGTNVGFQGFLYSAKDKSTATIKKMKANKVETAMKRTERRVGQYQKYLAGTFPGKDSKYYWEPGDFTVGGKKAADEEEDDDDDEEAVAVAAPVKSKKSKPVVEEEEEAPVEEKAQAEDEEEEEAPVAKAAPREEQEEAEEEDVPPPAPVVQKIDLDTDVDFLLDETDADKRQKDMSENREASMEIQTEAPVYMKWWFWTIIGTVLVAGGITAGVLLAPEGPDNTPTFQLN